MLADIVATTVTCDICECIPEVEYCKIRNTEIDLSLTICGTCYKNLTKYNMISKELTK